MEEDLTREFVQEIIGAINHAAQYFCAPPAIKKDKHLLQNPEFERAVSRYDSITLPTIKKYGSSNNYFVLDLDVRAGIKDIDRTSSFLQRKIANTECDPENKHKYDECGLVLLANDDVIVRHEEALKRIGFSFLGGWRLPNSLYRRLVEAGRKYGQVYEMQKQKGVWIAVRKN